MVSIVVPTRNRPAALARCLSALAAQRGLDAFEIVVVDDGTAERADVGAAVRVHSRARLVHGGGGGPATARNAGVAAAAGAVLCFTDDDCEPQPDWAALLVRAIDGGADVVGGLTVSGRAGDPYLETSEMIVRLLQQSTHRRLSSRRRVFIPSNNMACRRALALAHPFDERYAMAGGEDRAWCASVASAGLSLTLEPRSIMAHNPALGLRGFWRQHVRYGRGAFRFGRGRAGDDWKEPPGFYLELLRAGAKAGVVGLALTVLAQVATTVGYVREAAVAMRVGSRSRTD